MAIFCNANKEFDNIDNLLIVDNPGEGNCAFYAFGIGLLPYLYSEIKNKVNNGLLAKLQPYLIPYIAEEDRWQYFKNKILAFDFHKPSRSILSVLNKALRDILAEQRKKNLEYHWNRGKIEDDVLFRDALGVYWHYYNNSDAHPDTYDNDVYNDPDLNEIIKYTGKSLKYNESVYGIKLKEPEMIRTLATMVLTETVPKANHEESKSTPRQTSPLRNFIENKRKEGVWCDEHDLVVLAEFFNVHIDIYNQGIKIPSHPEDKPVIRINNLDNRHWVSLVNIFGQSPPEEVSHLMKFHKYVKTVALTPLEIFLVMNDYTGNNSAFCRFIHFNWNRHHVGLANLIAAKCKEGQSVDEIIQFASQAINRIPNVNKAGDLMQCMDYICLRHYGKKFERVNKELNDHKQIPAISLNAN